MKDETLISPIQPRILRLPDACRYLGISKTLFNREVRPHVAELNFGGNSSAFDRLDLDRWVEDHKHRNGRLGQSQGDRLWDVINRRGSPSGVGSGTLTKSSTDSELESLLVQATSKKPKRF